MGRFDNFDNQLPPAPSCVTSNAPRSGAGCRRWSAGGSGPRSSARSVGDVTMDGVVWRGSMCEHPIHTHSMKRAIPIPTNTQSTHLGPQRRHQPLDRIQHPEHELALLLRVPRQRVERPAPLPVEEAGALCVRGGMCVCPWRRPGWVGINQPTQPPPGVVRGYRSRRATSTVSRKRAQSLPATTNHDMDVPSDRRCRSCRSSSSSSSSS